VYEVIIYPSLDITGTPRTWAQLAKHQTFVSFPPLAIGLEKSEVVCKVVGDSETLPEISCHDSRQGYSPILASEL
jgi:hypothetical protein